MFKSLYTLNDLSQKEIEDLMTLTEKIKKNPKEYENALHGKTLAMFFESASLRTRCSFEVAMNQMGGSGLFLKNPPPEKFPADKRDITRFISDLYLANIASIKDEVQVMSRYVNAITWRSYSDEVLKACIEYATVPVINAMTPGFHPCQGLTDLFTILEKKGKFKGLNLTLYGDLGREAGTNVANDLFIGSAKVGINVTACVPEMRANMPTRGFAKQSWDWAVEEAKKTGSTIKIEHDPFKAAKNADVIYAFYQGTQVGGKGANPSEALSFPEYQVRKALVDNAKPDVIVLHCLPATRELEITGEVLDGPHSVVYDQAENRLHTQKALLLTLMK